MSTSEHPASHADARVEGRLTHVREDGSAHMVDVSDKPVTSRIARARSRLQTTPEVVAQVFDGTLPKGDAVSVARVAGIMAAKRTSELVPLCHPLPISTVTVDIVPDEASASIRVETLVKTTGVTGVEMEALTAASVTALTLYDMIKALDRGATIVETGVLAKSGGLSGDWERT